MEQRAVVAQERKYSLMCKAYQSSFLRLLLHLILHLQNYLAHSEATHKEMGENFVIFLNPLVVFHESRGVFVTLERGLLDPLLRLLEVLGDAKTVEIAAPKVVLTVGIAQFSSTTKTFGRHARISLDSLSVQVAQTEIVECRGIILCGCLVIQREGLGQVLRYTGSGGVAGAEIVLCISIATFSSCSIPFHSFLHVGGNSMTKVVALGKKKLGIRVTDFGSLTQQRNRLTVILACVESRSF